MKYSEILNEAKNKRSVETLLYDNEGDSKPSMTVKKHIDVIDKFLDVITDAQKTQKRLKSKKVEFFFDDMYLGELDEKGKFTKGDDYMGFLKKYLPAKK